ncbi:MAG TPA: NrfD/PsrC family molybdoenzyme membrane anchor subunit [Vicinamibacterales bacterium]|jgi:molybdopterin-containing oxidoreductase family membrane subunit
MFMLEKALRGGRGYWAWTGALLAVVCVGAWCYWLQLQAGLGITGLSRDIVWGLYIAQFTFLVGVAASAVMVVLPYYLHDFRVFGRVTILGEFLAIAAVTMCVLFIVVDMGRPSRVLNVLLHPTPGSMMFWDMAALAGYLLLNVLITRVTLEAERNDIAPPRWIRPVIIVSIPWAISIHTVTAFLYSGLPGRSFWLTAILAPRFLASAFAAGPALLILLCLVARRLRLVDVGREALQKLAVLVAYAVTVHVFLVLVEVFTVFYSQVPEHVAHFRYLYAGLAGHAALVPWMWSSAGLLALALGLLLAPRTRAREGTLVVACLATFVGLWIDKGLGLIVGGLVPSALGAVFDYSPTFPELTITIGIWALGALMVTAFLRITSGVRSQESGARSEECPGRS